MYGSLHLHAWLVKTNSIASKKELAGPRYTDMACETLLSMVPAVILANPFSSDACNSATALLHALNCSAFRRAKMATLRMVSGHERRLHIGG